MFKWAYDMNMSKQVYNYKHLTASYMSKWVYTQIRHSYMSKWANAQIILLLTARYMSKWAYRQLPVGF